VTLILRANGKIANPRKGSLLAPQIDVPGQVMRWVPASDHADGEEVTTVLDQLGSKAGRFTAGSGAMALIDGISGLKLNGTAALSSDSFAFPSRGQRTMAALVHFGKIPNATKQLIGSQASGQSMVACIAFVGGPPAGRMVAYGDSAIWPTSQAVGAGWHRVIVAFDGAAGRAKICVDGNLVEGAVGWASQGTSAFASIRSDDTVSLSFADYVMLDHTATDEEIRTIDAALSQWQS